MNTYNVIWLDQLGINDIDRVGGKNASLGEMIQNLGNLGVNVPGGFATTSDAYRGFLSASPVCVRVLCPQGCKHPIHQRRRLAPWIKFPAVSRTAGECTHYSSPCVPPNG